MKLKAISKLFPQDVEIPGDRVPMREEDFFGLWVTQHRKKIHYCRKKVFGDTNSERVLLDSTFFDLALALYQNHPEVVEENNN